MEISKCYKSGLLSPRELVVEHLSAWVWPSSPRTRKLGVSVKPASGSDLSPVQSRGRKFPFITSDRLRVVRGESQEY